MAYLYKLFIVVEDDSENIYLQNSIDDSLENLLKKYTNVQFVGSSIHELENDNCGKCCKCGTWVSDHNKRNRIDEFSDGCIIDEKWFCDICLPSEHPKHF